MQFPSITEKYVLAFINQLLIYNQIKCYMIYSKRNKSHMVMTLMRRSFNVSWSIYTGNFSVSAHVSDDGNSLLWSFTSRSLACLNKMEGCSRNPVAGITECPVTNTSILFSSDGSSSVIYFRIDYFQHCLSYY